MNGLVPGVYHIGLFFASQASTGVDFHLRISDHTWCGRSSLINAGNTCLVVFRQRIAYFQVAQKVNRLVNLYPFLESTLDQILACRTRFTKTPEANSEVRCIRSQKRTNDVRWKPRNIQNHPIVNNKDLKYYLKLTAWAFANHEPLQYSAKSQQLHQ